MSNLQRAALAACLCAAALHAAPAHAQILRRLGERARDRVKEKVESGVERAVDGAANAVSGAARKPSGDSASAVPASRPPASTAAPTASESTRPNAAASTNADPSTPTPSAESPSAASAATAPSRSAASSASLRSPASAPAAADATAVAAGRPAGPGDPVARREALATGFRDGDMAWLLPLLRARVQDQQALSRGLAAAAGGTGLGAVESVRAEDEAVLQRLRSGQDDALAMIRRQARAEWAVVPPGARYDRACSVAATEGQFALGHDDVVAVFTFGLAGPSAAELARGPTGTGVDALRQALGANVATPEGAAAVERTVAFYRAHGFHYTAPVTTSHLLSPRLPSGDDAGFTVNVMSFNALAVAAGIPGDACRNLGNGPVIEMFGGTGRGLGERVGEAVSAAAGDTHALDRALERARLSKDEWGRLIAQLMMDSTYADQPQAALTAIMGDQPAKLRVTRANLAFYRANRATLQPLFDAAAPRGQ